MCCGPTTTGSTCVSSESRGARARSVRPAFHGAASSSEMFPTVPWPRENLEKHAPTEACVSQANLV